MVASTKIQITLWRHVEVLHAVQQVENGSEAREMEKQRLRSATNEAARDDNRKHLYNRIVLDAAKRACVPSRYMHKTMLRGS